MNWLRYGNSGSSCGGAQLLSKALFRMLQTDLQRGDSATRAFHIV